MNFQNKKYNRKEFITFLGKVTLGATFIPPFLMSYGNTSMPIKTGDISNEQLERLKKLSLEGLAASDQDDLLLTKGLDYHVILKWNDKKNNEDRFGFNCDYNCFIPLDPKNPNDGLLWVNHEYINPLFVSGLNYRGFDLMKLYRADCKVFSVRIPFQRHFHVDFPYT